MTRLVVVLVALFLVPPVASAGAGTVSVRDDEVRYVAAPGTADLLEVSRSASAVTFRAPGIVAGPGCDTRPDGSVRCAAGVRRVRVATGDGDDRIRIGRGGRGTVEAGPGNDVVLLGGPRGWTASGGAGDDELDADEGTNVVRGGSGADVLRGRLGPRSRCGPGSDTVRLEFRLPRTVRDCERFILGLEAEVAPARIEARRRAVVVPVVYRGGPYALPEGVRWTLRGARGRTLGTTYSRLRPDGAFRVRIPLLARGRRCVAAGPCRAVLVMSLPNSDTIPTEEPHPRDMVGTGAPPEWPLRVRLALR